MDSTKIRTGVFVVDSFLFTLFEGLDRQGPGSDTCTTRMFDLLSPPKNAQILDIGCGAGMQTCALARRCRSCTITAVDIHQPFLDALMRKAEAEGLNDRVTTCCASMDDLPFAPGSNDVIWSEGSVFIMGFEKGISYWKQFLRSGGSLALSEMVWFTDNPADEVAEFMHDGYPAMTTVLDCERMIRKAGYRLIGSYRLPDEAWWVEFYDPLEEKIARIGDRYIHDPDAAAILDMTRQEIALFRKYSDQYGYQFFLLRNPL